MITDSIIEQKKHWAFSKKYLLFQRDKLFEFGQSYYYFVCFINCVQFMQMISLLGKNFKEDNNQNKLHMRFYKECTKYLIGYELAEKFGDYLSIIISVYMLLKFALNIFAHRINSKRIIPIDY